MAYIETLRLMARTTRQVISPGDKLAKLRDGSEDYYLLDSWDADHPGSFATLFVRRNGSGIRIPMTAADFGLTVIDLQDIETEVPRLPRQETMKRQLTRFFKKLSG